MTNEDRFPFFRSWFQEEPTSTATFAGSLFTVKPGEMYSPQILDLLNSSYPTQPHSLIAKYFMHAGMQI